MDGWGERYFEGVKELAGERVSRWWWTVVMVVEIRDLEGVLI